MKRFAIALIIALMIPACIFAGRGLFDLTLGVAASTTYDIEKAKEGEIKNITLDDFKFGADAEVKLAFVSVDGKLFYDQANKGISGLVSANIAADIFFVRVKAGLGYQYTYNFDTKTFSLGNEAGIVNDFANFKDACFDVNAGVDFLIGPVTVGAYATLPTETSIANGQWGELFKALAEKWNLAQLGLTVGFALL